MIGEVFNVLGLIWKGGKLVQEVNDHDRRILSVENHGSSALSAHVKFSDERVSGLKERTTRLENILIELPDLQKDVAVVNVKVDSIQKTLDELAKRMK